MKTEAIDTSIADGINGGRELYQKDGLYTPRVIDLSGFTVGLGLGLHF